LKHPGLLWHESPVKFNSLRANWRIWLSGTAIAVTGVIIARLVAPHFEGKTQAVLSMIGRFTGFAGLIVIVFGVNRRLKRDSQENP